MNKREQPSFVWSSWFRWLLAPALAVTLQFVVSSYLRQRSISEATTRTLATATALIERARPNESAFEPPQSRWPRIPLSERLARNPFAVPVALQPRRTVRVDAPVVPADKVSTRSDSHSDVTRLLPNHRTDAVGVEIVSEELHHSPIEQPVDPLPSRPSDERRLPIVVPDVASQTESKPR
jgi:hypothetical protein